MKLLSSIKRKALLLLLLFGILPTLMLTSYFYSSLKDTLVDKAGKQLISLRLNKKQQVEDFFKDRMSEVKLFANSEELNSLFNSFFGKGNNKNDSHLITLLRKSDFENYEFIKYIIQTGYYSYFALSNDNIFLEGYVDKKSHKIINISINKLFNSKLESLWIRSSIWQRTLIQDFNTTEKVDFNTLYLAAPLFSRKNNFAGMFVLGISPKTFQKLLKNGASDVSIFRTEETYIIGRDYLIRSSSTINVKNLPNKKIPYENVWNAFNYSNIVKQMYNYNKNKVLASLGVLNIPFLNWSIISSANLDEILKPIYTLQVKIIVFLVILTLFIFLSALYISKKFTKPVLKLQTAVNEISKGNFNSLIDVETNDEIGNLSKSFNKMVLKLKDSTSKLKEREQRLFHFYSATNDGIVLHKGNKPLLVNRTLTKLTSYSKEELLSLDVESLFSNQRYNINNENDSLIFETKLKLKDGKEISVEVQEKNIEYNEETVRASVIRDITRRKKIEKELEIEKNKHLTNLFDGQELERQRLSRDLHDGLGQSLIALQLRLQNILNKNDDENGASIQEAINSLDKTIEEIRRMSNNLMPAILSQFGLSEAINKLCVTLNKHSKTKIEYVGKSIPLKLEPRTIIYLYRIVQEALSNIIKYSSAGNAVVKLVVNNKSLMLSIVDDGIGLTERNKKEGSGIYNMKERAKLLNGEFKLDSAEGLGTKIIVKVPLN